MKKRIQFHSLKEWREAHGLSQREAARHFGLSQPGWNKYELHQRMPRREIAGRLASETGVPLAAILGISL